MNTFAVLRACTISGTGLNPGDKLTVQVGNVTKELANGLLRPWTEEDQRRFDVENESIIAAYLDE
jgi:hypothetical protein